MPKHSADLQTLNTEWLDIQDFEYLCFNLAREQLTYSEPIPDYSTRDQAKLEASLSSPQHTFGGKFLYPTLPKQAAILFYSFNKNHAFQNGNKRIAIMTLLAFLSLNNKWLMMHPDDLYDIALNVSSSKREEKDLMLKELAELIEEHLEDSKF